MPLVAAAPQKVHARGGFSPTQFPPKFAVFGSFPMGFPPEPAACGTGYSLKSQATGARSLMARCETCGNDYDKAFQVSMDGTTHTFDSFECAIHALAPKCDNCGIRIMGHGLEKEGTFFCCEHCAEKAGVTGLRDRIGAAA